VDFEKNVIKTFSGQYDLYYSRVASNGQGLEQTVIEKEKTPWNILQKSLRLGSFTPSKLL
jgi:hypothetical protein